MTQEQWDKIDKELDTIQTRITQMTQAHEKAVEAWKLKRPDFKEESLPLE